MDLAALRQRRGGTGDSDAEALAYPLLRVRGMGAFQSTTIRRLAFAVGLLNLVLFVAAAGAAVRLVMPATPTGPAASVALRVPAPPPAGDPSTSGPAAAGRAEGQTAAAHAAAIVIERGLFGRAEPQDAGATPRPPEGAADAPAAAPPLLVGTAVGPAGRGAAVFADGHGGQLLVGIGEPIDDYWRLVAVGRAVAVVEGSDGRRQEVPLALPQ